MAIRGIINTKADILKEFRNNLNNKDLRGLTIKEIIKYMGYEYKGNGVYFKPEENIEVKDPKEVKGNSSGR